MQISQATSIAICTLVVIAVGVAYYVKENVEPKNDD